MYDSIKNGIFKEIHVRDYKYSSNFRFFSMDFEQFIMTGQFYILLWSHLIFLIIEMDQSVQSHDQIQC
uniref:Uncharacterized protein n=1 Tax=Solanum lycopersicum TaxID=4081 RepID=K4AW20_SOLLC